LEAKTGVLDLELKVDISTYGPPSLDFVTNRRRADLLKDVILDKLGYRFTYVFRLDLFYYAMP
jgi:hypothetical protein